jgi:segregation and condensation protein B
MNSKALLEAALFMANKPLSESVLSKLLRCDSKDVRRIVAEIRQELAARDRGIHLVQTAEGWQLRVKPEYAQSVRHLTPYKDLSRGLLRVLALVAYKQPITQAEIVKVIGNRTYEYVRKLVEKGLIRTVKAGRTKALIATKEFANYFGLEDPADIKKFFCQHNELKQD